MRKIIDVFLLAENRLLREALIRLISKKNDVRVVGANSYAPAVHEEIIARRPHIILLDSNALTFSKRKPYFYSARRASKSSRGDGRHGEG